MVRSSRAWGTLTRLSALGGPAAEMAFYFALSMVPFLGFTAVLAVVWLPPELGQPLARTLVGLFPAEAGLDPAAIADWVGSVSSNWLAAGVLLAAWSSFRFMVALVRALSSLGNGPRDQVDWAHRLHSALSALVLMVLWMLALLTTSFVLLAAPALEETLAARRLLEGHGATAANLSRLLAALVLLLAISLTYRAIPGVGARGWRPWVMGFLATAGWIGVAELARQVLPALWSAHNPYGALGSFVVFLMWCWANAWVVLACGLLAAQARPPRR